MKSIADSLPNRRAFLAGGLHGLPGIALAAMLAEESLPAPSRIDPTRPYAPR